MIKFFRKIRHKLIQESRFSKYLIYAIGEIVLVVIGILIALWLNNLNQENLDNKREDKILQELQKEFASAATELKNDLKARERHHTATTRLLDFHLEKDSFNIPQDSLSFNLISLISTRFYSTGHPILEDLSSSGNIELIKSDVLRQLLASYIQEKNRYTLVEEREATFVNEQLIPLITKFVDFSKVQNGTVNVDNLERTFQDLKVNKRYGSVLQLRLQRIHVSMSYGSKLLDVINEIIDTLSQEIVEKDD
nr:DUF6090 family protein [Allomuricauda sp.]